MKELIPTKIIAVITDMFYINITKLDFSSY